MNIYSVLSFLLAGLIFFFGIFTATDNFRAVLDFHASLIVFGGTIAVTAISFQMDRLFAMLSVFYNKVIRGRKINYAQVIKDLIALAEVYRKNPTAVDSLLNKINDPFLKEGVGILRQGFLSEEEFYHLMLLRSKTIHNRYLEDAKKFKAIGKFPPAMGLMGAVLGMIALLLNLGKPGAEESLGPSMSVALVATLYGIALANLVVLPIADNLSDSANEVAVKNRIIVEALKLISENKNKVILNEHLNSYLLPHERTSGKEAA